MRTWICKDFNQIWLHDGFSDHIIMEPKTETESSHLPAVLGCCNNIINPAKLSRWHHYGPFILNKSHHGTAWLLGAGRGHSWEYAVDLGRPLKVCKQHLRLISPLGLWEGRGSRGTKDGEPTSILTKGGQGCEDSSKAVVLPVKVGANRT